MRQYLFLLLTLFSVSAIGQNNYEYRYWFDFDTAQVYAGYSVQNRWFLDVDLNGFSGSMHTLHIQVKDTANVWSSPCSKAFLYTGNIKDLIGEYWFDDDSTIYKLPLNSVVEIDVNHINEGFHTFNYRVNDVTTGLSTTGNSLFVKIPKYLADKLRYNCLIDGKLFQTNSINASEGIVKLDFDVSQISYGLHNITIQLITDNGGATTAYSNMFYKTTPQITRYEYWINDDFANRKVTTFEEPQDSFKLISLLDVNRYPIRSSCFHFSIKDGNPTITAKNQFNILVVDNNGGLSNLSKDFLDELVTDIINVDEIKTITSGVPETMPRPAENEIQWYKFEAENGDYIAFKSNYASTIQVFSPSGENIYSASGPESIKMNGSNIWETGTYYVAIHDVTAKNSKNINVDFIQIDKYAVFSYTSHKMGNGGVNKVRFEGNGYFMLDSVLLKQNNTIIPSCGTKLISNTKIDALFDCENAPIGKYDLVMIFPDDTLMVKNAFEIEPSNEMLFTSTVKYSNQVLIGSEVNYKVSVKNQSNMTAYKMPIYVYVETPLNNTIPVIDITNVDLPSPLDNVDLSEFTESEVQELKKFAEVIGDGLCFWKLRDVNEKGDSILIQSTYLFVDVLPYETLEFGVNIRDLRTAVSVYVTVPDDYHSLRLVSDPTNKSVKSIQPYGVKDWYCCYKERIECIVNAAGMTSDLVNKIAKRTGNLQAETISAITSCVLTAVGALSDFVGGPYCEEEPADLNAMEMALNTSAAYSLTMSIKDCLLEKLMEKIKDQIGGMGKWWDVINEINNLTVQAGATIYDCYEAFAEKKPNCPPTPPKGGTTTPIHSGDPNDILGYIAESGSMYIGKHIDKVTYMIEFENDSMLATAPAHTILLADTLDSNVFDVATVTPIKLQIGDKSYDFSSDFKGVATVDMRPEIYAIAQVSMNVDDKGVLTWVLESLDPMTMEPITQPFNGILPINDAEGAGMGFVSFSVNLKKGLQDGTEVANKANIIFDANEPISTPYWINETDYVDPVSVIDTIECLNDSVIDIKFHGFDERSGIWKYDLYYKPGIESDWFILAEGLTEPSYQLRVYDNISYGFCVVATDKAGNREVKDLYPELQYLNGTMISGIETIEIDKVNINDGILYDLLGRRVNIPSSGIFVRNGKKILIK